MSFFVFLHLAPPPASWAQSLSPKHISSLQTFSEPTQVTVQGTPKQVSPSTLRCLPLYCTEWVPGQGKPELLHHRMVLLPGYKAPCCPSPGSGCGRRGLARSENCELSLYPALLWSGSHSPQIGEVRHWGCDGGWGAKPGLLPTRCPPVMCGPQVTDHPQRAKGWHILPLPPPEALLDRPRNQKLKSTHNPAISKSDKLVINPTSHS